MHKRVFDQIVSRVGLLLSPPLPQVAHNQQVTYLNSEFRMNPSYGSRLKELCFHYPGTFLVLVAEVCFACYGLLVAKDGAGYIAVEHVECLAGRCRVRNTITRRCRGGSAITMRVDGDICRDDNCANIVPRHKMDAPKSLSSTRFGRSVRLIQGIYFEVNKIAFEGYLHNYPEHCIINLF